MTQQDIDRLLAELRYVRSNNGLGGVYYTPPDSCENKSYMQIVCDALTEILEEMKKEKS